MENMDTNSATDGYFSLKFQDNIHNNGKQRLLELTLIKKN